MSAARQALDRTVQPFKQFVRRKVIRPGSRSVWLPLRWQLVLIMLPLALLPVLVVSLVGRSITEQGLTVLITQDAQDRATSLGQQFSAYYAKNGTWTGVLANLTDSFYPPVPNWLWITVALHSGVPLPKDLIQTGNTSSSDPSPAPPDIISLAERFTRRFTPEQILITDPSGMIVATDGSTGLGDRLAQSVLTQGVAITANNKTVGYLVIGGALGILNRQQSAAIDTINSALLVAALIAGGLTLLAGLWLSWQITHPVQQLMIGVQRLAHGEWGAPLTVRARNEFGELTHAFNQMASEVMRQEQLRRQIVADVAHDLRTPLSAMQLEIEALEAGFQSPLAAAASLREEVEWLQHLIDDLRLLSLMDADQVALAPVEVPLDSFLADVVDFWQPLAEDRERTLCLDTMGDLPRLPIDVQRMRRVIGNLLDNALRHTSPGSQITVRGSLLVSNGLSSGGDGQMAALTVTQTATRLAVIEVQDDGEGISPADLPHIFDRFYRADRARTHDHSHDHTSDQAGGVTRVGRVGAPGSGLGLSIAQRLVELHGGTITVRSTLGVGTIFTIQLPCTATTVPRASLPYATRGRTRLRSIPG